MASCMPESVPLLILLANPLPHAAKVVCGCSAANQKVRVWVCGCARCHSGSIGHRASPSADLRGQVGSRRDVACRLIGNGIKLQQLGLAQGFDLR